MRFIAGLALVLATAAGGPSFAEAAIPWRLDADRALREARRDDRPALLTFGTTWCEKCRQLETTTFRDPAVVEGLRGLVTVYVDGDRDPELTARFHVLGYPTLIVLSPEGKVLWRATEALGSDDLLRMLHEVGAACSLQGVVHDDAGRGRAARVSVLPAGPFAATDTDGFYCLRDLPPGPTELLVESDDLIETSVAVVEQDERTPRHDVAISGRLGERVVVTATRTTKLLREVPVRTEVVSRDQIDRTAARTLAEAVEFTPGVRVESNCQSCNFSQVRMLGLEGAYTQILIDGQAQWSPLSMVYGIEEIPSRLIERLEVVKGGGSTTYGPGAVGGVINVIPRQPGRSGGVVELRGEVMDGDGARSLNGAWDWVAPGGSSFVTLYGQDDRVPGMDLSGDGFTELSKRELTTLGLRGRHVVLGGAGRLTVDAGWSDSYRRGGDSLDLPPEQAELAEEISTDRRSLSLRWSHEATSKWSYHVAASHVNTERDTYYGAGQDPNAFGFSRNPLLLVEAQADRRSDRHTVSWGTQLQRDTVEDRQASIDRTLQETYTNVGLFVQDDWKLGPRKSLLYGVRADRHSAIEGAIFSPRLAFLWNPKPDLALRSAVSTGFRPPAVFDEDLHIEMAGGSQRQVVFSPNLEEERSLSVLQGVAWNPKIRERFWLVDANLFYTRIEDIFEENQLADDVFEKVNGGSATVRGIELGLGYDLPRLFTIELGWVSQRSRFAEPERDFGSRDFLRTPRDSGVLNLSFRSVRLGEAFIGVRYTGPMKVPRWLFDDAGNPTGRQLVESDEFLTIDASVSRRFDLGARGTKLRLQIGARNLTDEFQNDIDQGAYRDSAYVYGPRYPRSFYLTTALSF